MITTINEFRKYNESNDEAEKNAWWDKHYKQLIEIVSTFEWEDWEGYYGDDEDAIQAEIESTGKHNALTLLHMHDIDELNEMLGIHIFGILNYKTEDEESSKSGGGFENLDEETMAKYIDITKANDIAKLMFAEEKFASLDEDQMMDLLGTYPEVVIINLIETKSTNESNTWDGKSTNSPIGQVDGFDLIYQTSSKMMGGDGINGTIRTSPENYYVGSINSDGNISFEDLESNTRDINKNKVIKLYNRFKAKNITESVINENMDDLKSHFNNMEEKRMGDFWISYYVENDKIMVVASGKRGVPHDAFFKALSIGKPTLPTGYEYVDGVAIDSNNEPVTRATILADDEIYDDRGYQESEFGGEVYYKFTKTTNEHISLFNDKKEVPDLVIAMNKKLNMEAQQEEDDNSIWYWDIPGVVLFNDVQAFYGFEISDLNDKTYYVGKDVDKAFSAINKMYL